MKYLWVPPRRRFFGPVHWGHTLFLYVKRDRLTDLKEFLDEVVGHNEWRIATPWTQIEKLEATADKSMDLLLANTKAILLAERKFSAIKFLDANHAMRVKLMWDECETPSGIIEPGAGSVILPLIRRVMPSVLAQDIIGVQSMQGPVGSIFAMRAAYLDSTT